MLQLLEMTVKCIMLKQGREDISTLCTVEASDLHAGLDQVYKTKKIKNMWRSTASLRGISNKM